LRVQPRCDHSDRSWIGSCSVKLHPIVLCCRFFSSGTFWFNSPRLHTGEPEFLCSFLKPALALGPPWDAWSFRFVLVPEVLLFFSFFGYIGSPPERPHDGSRTLFLPGRTRVHLSEPPTHLGVPFAWGSCLDNPSSLGSFSPFTLLCRCITSSCSWTIKCDCGVRLIERILRLVSSLSPKICPCKPFFFFFPSFLQTSLQGLWKN